MNLSDINNISLYHLKWELMLINNDSNLNLLGILFGWIQREVERERDTGRQRETHTETQRDRDRERERERESARERDRERDTEKKERKIILTNINIIIWEINYLFVSKSRVFIYKHLNW